MIENCVLEVANLIDINDVLLLQDLYLVSNLSSQEKEDGFVTTPFSVEQLTYVINNQGLFIAKVNNKIIAYIFAESWDYFSQYPIFEYMITLIPNLKFQDYNFTTKNSFQYGPVCIHKEYRGKGLINLLFEFMRVRILEKYPLSLTFINKINKPSLKAHVEKLNWSIISKFHFNNNEYFILAYDMTKAVV